MSASVGTGTIKTGTAEQVPLVKNMKKKKKGASPENSFLSVIHLIQHADGSMVGSTPKNPSTLNAGDGQSKRLVTAHSMAASPANENQTETRETRTAKEIEALVKKAQSLAAQSGKSNINDKPVTKHIEQLQAMVNPLTPNKSNVSIKGLVDHLGQRQNEPLGAEDQQISQPVQIGKQRVEGNFSKEPKQSLGESLFQRKDVDTHARNAVQGKQSGIKAQIADEPINVIERQSEQLTRSGKQNSEKGWSLGHLDDAQPLISKSSLGNQKGQGQSLSLQTNGFERSLLRPSETRLIRQGNQASPKATLGRPTEQTADHEGTSLKRMSSSENPTSKKQTRLDHHRAVSGQMSKLELWATFQSEKSSGKQGTVSEQVADHLNEWLGKSSFKLDKNGVQSYTVTLYPEHLGKLVISVSRGEQGLTAQLTAETQKAKELLESNLGQLKHDCAGRGITLVQIDVNRQLHQAFGDTSQYQGQNQSAFQQNTDQQEENHKQHRENHPSAPDQEQKEHSFSEWMTGGVV